MAEINAEIVRIYQGVPYETARHPATIYFDTTNNVVRIQCLDTAARGFVFSNLAAGGSETTQFQVSATGAVTMNGNLTLSPAVSKIVPGATSLSLRNHADGADNVLISDAGAVTVRAGLTVTAGGATVTAGGLTVTAGGATITAGGLTVSAGQVSLTPAQTIASAAGATWAGLSVPGTTATISGSTNITTAGGFNLATLAAPTLSAALALTVTNAATLAIAGAPSGAGAGPATITNAYSLWVQAGTSRFDADLTVKANTPTALTVGLNGPTNPALVVDASTAASATGLKVKSAAAAAGVAVSAISSGTDEALTVDAKGAGTLTLQGTGTGSVLVGQNLHQAGAGTIFLGKYTEATQSTGVTLTAAQLLGGLINSAPGAGITLTLPTAAAMVAGIAGAKVGDAFFCTIQNTSGGANAITLAAGGATLRGGTSIAQNKGALLVGVLTNVGSGTEAYTVYSLVSA